MLIHSFECLYRYFKTKKGDLFDLSVILRKELNQKIQERKMIMAENKSVFETLNAVDVSSKVKTKNNLSYISWASSWAEVKKIYPDATYKRYEQVMDDYGNTKPWFDDGHTGWVKVGVTINGQEMVEVSPITYNTKNVSIPADEITTIDVNRSTRRCISKACALHGLALYIYEGEDLPEEVSKTIELKEKIKKLVAKKVALSDKAKLKVAELCKAAEKQANPNLDDDLITGNYNNIEDADILINLEKQLLAVRK